MKQECRLDAARKCTMNTRLIVRTSVAALLVAALESCNASPPNEPSPNCSFAISPAATTIESGGGGGNVTITTAAGCTWSATASAGWISISGVASGTGPGTVAYSVGPTSSTSSRSGTLTIAGQIHTITQQGRTPTACTYELSPQSADLSKDGGAGTFTVTAPADCAWTASSDSPWLTITGGAQGSGTNTVSYTAARSTDIADRTGTISVADRRFTLRQLGDAGLCQYSVAPVALSACMAAGTLASMITTQAGCSWTATSSAGWLHLSSGTGQGTTAISITFTENYDAPREGIVMVRWPTVTAGQNIRVAQAGCRYAVSRAAFSFAAAGGTGTFDVIQQSDPTECGGATQDRCVWTAQSQVPWITITSSMPRSGDNPASFSVAANDSTAPRTGTIVVRDKVVTITQAGK
jgi:hypothetical protein